MNSYSLTSSRLLARSTFWNLAAQLFPVMMAIVCIPLIIAAAGIERFGVLTLAWALIGYSGMFDLGLGRAITKLVAEQIGSSTTEIASIVVTGIGLMLIIGLAGSAVFFSVTPWLVESVLNIPDDLKSETLTGFYLIAATVPIVTINAGLRGVAEAHQNFRFIAFVGLTTSVVSFIGPLVSLQLVKSASAMILMLVLARLLGAILYALAALRAIDGTGRKRVSRKSAKRLIEFGSWVTISNVIGPLMDNLDRFVIGGLLSVSAVAYYATPFDIVSRLGTVSGALTGVLFPAFATALIADRVRALDLFQNGIKYMIIAVAPLVLVIFAFAEEGLRLWLGDNFANQSAPVVQLLALGFLVNAVSRMPYALLQAGGYPHLTALLHLLELPIYLVLIWWLVSIWGIAGAAAAWSLRVLLDTTLLIYVGNRLFKIPWNDMKKSLLTLGVITGLVSSVALVDQTLPKTAYFTGVFTLMAWIIHHWLLTPGELTRLIGHARNLRDK